MVILHTRWCRCFSERSPRFHSERRSDKFFAAPVESLAHGEARYTTMEQLKTDGMPTLLTWAKSVKLPIDFSERCHSHMRTGLQSAVRARCGDASRAGAALAAHSHDSER